MEKNVNDTITMANSINAFGEKIPKYVAKKNWSNAASTNTVIYIYATSNNVDHLETRAGETILQTNIKNNIFFVLTFFKSYIYGTRLRIDKHH